MTIGYLSRWETFSAAHRLHSQHLSPTKNQEIYGKCNYPNGHGHNYKVQVTLRGKIDPATGMIINLHDLKLIIHQVIDLLDHRNIDKDIDYFAKSGRPSTAENIAVFIWLEISKRLDTILLEAQDSCVE
ncbi:hypothetical protein EV182_004511, partial [Spiromyces aspiralis]